MKLSLSGKKLSREELEREATEEIEALVRAGDRPPPPSWTLAGGLPLEGSAAADTPVVEAADAEKGSAPRPGRSGATPQAAKRRAARAARAASMERSGSS